MNVANDIYSFRIPITKSGCICITELKQNNDVICQIKVFDSIESITLSHFKQPELITRIEPFEFNDIVSTRNIARNLLNPFKIRVNTYNCSYDWVYITMVYIQRKVNNDNDLMDVDLPYVK